MPKNFGQGFGAFVFDFPGRMIMGDPCQWDKTSYLPRYIWSFVPFHKE